MTQAALAVSMNGCSPSVPAASGIDLAAGNAYRVIRVLPAGHYDQRHCSGCYREQDHQASGLSPSGSGRSFDLSNQALEGAFQFSHLPSP
jgi:hypothetical protein